LKTYNNKGIPKRPPPTPKNKNFDLLLTKFQRGKIIEKVQIILIKLMEK
jgi:hypothetical protein